MKQKLNTMVAVAALALPLTGGFAATKGKSNILIIWGDDIGQFNISAYNMGYKTPRVPVATGNMAITSRV